MYAFYNSPDPDYPGISFCTPVRDLRGRLTGVLTADFNMVELGSFLDGLQIFDEGFAFIVEFSDTHGRRVIAHPNSQLLLKRVEELLEA